MLSMFFLGTLTCFTTSFSLIKGKKFQTFLSTLSCIVEVLAVALEKVAGGSVEGPTGTGKSETVKERNPLFK